MTNIFVSVHFSDKIIIFRVILIQMLENDKQCLASGNLRSALEVCSKGFAMVCNNFLHTNRFEPKFSLTTKRLNLIFDIDIYWQLTKYHFSWNYFFPWEKSIHFCDTTSAAFTNSGGVREISESDILYLYIIQNN